MASAGAQPPGTGDFSAVRSMQRNKQLIAEGGLDDDLLYMEKEQEE